MIILVDEREMVTSAYGTGFAREGISSVGFEPPEFEDWVDIAANTVSRNRLCLQLFHEAWMAAAPQIVSDELASIIDAESHEDCYVPNLGTAAARNGQEKGRRGRGTR